MQRILQAAGAVVRPLFLALLGLLPTSPLSASAHSPSTLSSRALTDVDSLCLQVHVKDLSRTLKKIADDPDALVVSAPADRREWDKLVQPPYSRPVYSVEAVFASVMHMDLKRGFKPDNRVDPQLHDD